MVTNKQQSGARIAYSDPPPIGTIVQWRERNRAYCLEAYRAHVRRDGAASYVLTWATVCKRCGARFTFSTGLAGYLNRVVCPACVKAVRQAHYARLRALRAGLPDDARRQRYQVLKERKGQLADGARLSRYRRHRPAR